MMRISFVEFVKEKSTNGFLETKQTLSGFCLQTIIFAQICMATIMFYYVISTWTKT